MSYQGKNFTTSGSEPAAFEEQTDGTLIQVVKVDSGNSLVGGFQSTNIAFEDGSTNSVLNVTAHGVAVGSILSFDQATSNQAQVRRVDSVTTNTITLAVPLPDLPVTGSSAAVFIPTILNTDILGNINLSGANRVLQGDGGGGNDPWTVNVVNTVAVAVNKTPSAGIVCMSFSDPVLSTIVDAVNIYLGASSFSFISVTYFWNGTDHVGIVTEDQS